MANTQPAKVSYFFGKGYADLGNTIKESWSRNLYSAGEQFTIAREKGCFTKELSLFGLSNKRFCDVFESVCGRWIC